MALTEMMFVTLFLSFCAFSTTFGEKSVVIFTEDNWTDMLKNEWMIEFYAPWCPACKALQKTWQEFAGWGPDLNIKVGQVDVTTSPGLSGRFMVTALPTIFHVLNGEFRQYKGSRDKEAFISFIEEKKWQQVDPIPGWKSPSSFQMSVVSGFFKLSQYLRQLHTKLMDEYGLPSWASYLLFAFGTIITGAILGLCLVCFIDLIYPPVKTQIVTPQELRRKHKDSDDELNDEDIKDDLIDDADNSDHSGTDSDKKGSQSNPNSPKSVKKRKVRRAE